MATLVLSIVAKITVGAAWQVHVTLVSEIYPTSHRALGYGTANSAARVGGILAPFVISMESGARLVVSYVVVAALTALSATACLLLAETKGKALQDTIATGTNQTVLEVLTVPEKDGEQEQEKDTAGLNHYQQERENP